MKKLIISIISILMAGFLVGVVMKDANSTEELLSLILIVTTAKYFYNMLKDVE